MKQILLSLLLALPVADAVAGGEGTTLVVWSKDGSKVVYDLSEEPKHTFTASDLVVSTNGVEVTYPLSSLLRFTYEKKDASSLLDITTGRASSFRQDGDCLVFTGLAAGSNVSLRSLNGALVFSKAVQAQGEYSFSLSGLAAGVYLVTVNGTTYKIVKK